MDEHDQATLDYLTMVPVQFFYKGKLLVTSHSWIYPSYRVGDPIMFDILPTDREKNRRPDAQWTSGYYIVKKIMHVIQEPKLGIFTTKLEVILDDPPDDEAIAGFERKLESDEGKPAIANRILRRPK